VSKLVLSSKVARQYDPASLQDIVRQVETQANQHAEGRIKARHGAMTAAPTAGNWEIGDFVWNSNPSLVSSDIADYVLYGWICTASGTPGTWRQARVIAEDISMVREPTLGTEVASTSGTSIDFTGIPSWAKRIIIQLVGVSTNGTSGLIVQLGDSGGVEATGYSGAGAGPDGGAAYTNYTSGFFVNPAPAAASSIHGMLTLSLEDATNFTWVGSGVFGLSNAATVVFSAGSKTLSGALDRVRITTAGGTDAFDAGAINILYD
jgi:hypothetical protein